MDVSQNCRGASGYHDFRVSKGAMAFYAYGFGDISLSGCDHGVFSSYQSATWIALKGSCASGNSL